jgi:hypothetical protein
MLRLACKRTFGLFNFSSLRTGNETEGVATFAENGA